MELEIRDFTKGATKEDLMKDGEIKKVESWDAGIVPSTKQLFFRIEDDEGYEVVLRFDNEEELDDLIKSFQYFKKYKRFPPCGEDHPLGLNGPW